MSTNDKTRPAEEYIKTTPHEWEELVTDVRAICAAAPDDEMNIGIIARLDASRIVTDECWLKQDTFDALQTNINAMQRQLDDARKGRDEQYQTNEMLRHHLYETRGRDLEDHSPCWCNQHAGMCSRDPDWKHERACIGNRNMTYYIYRPFQRLDL